MELRLVGAGTSHCPATRCHIWPHMDEELANPCISWHYHGKLPICSLNLVT